MKKITYMLLSMSLVWVACEKNNDELIPEDEFETQLVTSNEAVTEMAEFFIQVAQYKLFEPQMRSISQKAATSKIPISVFEAVDQLPAADLYQIKNSRASSARSTFDWQS